MNAVDIRQPAGVATTRRPIRHLARLWAIGTGIAVLLVAATYQPANGIAGPLVVTGVGEVTLANVIGFTIFGAERYLPISSSASCVGPGWRFSPWH